MAENTLYYGDNLEILRDYIPSESVDLVYLDPPFKSDQNYNVLYSEQPGIRSAAQIQAFEDTWKWDTAAVKAYQEVVEHGPEKVSKAMQAFRGMIGDNDVLAYLSMMAPRLVELQRILKPHGSIYLHCDPTASHYLKLLLDAVMGKEQFRSEIVWKRTSAHSASKRWNDVHDTILFYTKSDNFIWNQVLVAHSDKYIARYKHIDSDGNKWADDNLTGPGIRHGDSGAVWRGFDPTSKGFHWKVSLQAVQTLVTPEHAKSMSTTEKLSLLDEYGFIYWPTSRDGSGGFPRFKRYLSRGVSVQDTIIDISPINSQAEERLGYPTQKPEALLERILKVSSNEDSVVLDPFCGCGTAIAVAERLHRPWIGIDITHIAINLIRHRLFNAFGDRAVYKIIGEPTSLHDARALAQQDRYQFQSWALGLVHARSEVQKKGRDRGIDGRLFFHDEGPTGKTKEIIFSVKSGNTGPGDVRDLLGVIEREKAAMGVFITLHESTRDMRSDAASAGFYFSPGWNQQYPKMQILTIAELLNGSKIQYPPSRDVNVTFRRAPRVQSEGPENLSLL